MSNIEVLQMVRPDPIPEPVLPEVCACKRCGSTSWNWILGATLVINTGKGRVRAGEENSYELRCSKCNRKATLQETAIIMGSKAGRKAQEMCGKSE